MLHVRCPYCNQRLSFDSATGGRKVACPQCQGVIPLPPAPQPSNDPTMQLTKKAPPVVERPAPFQPAPFVPAPQPVTSRRKRKRLLSPDVKEFLATALLVMLTSGGGAAGLVLSLAALDGQRPITLAIVGGHLGFFLAAGICALFDVAV